LLLAAAPAFPQATPPEPDPLARIRAQPPAQVCSEAQPTLCAEAAPKIIANAMGADSTIEANLRALASGEGGHAMGAPAPQSVVDQTRATDWAVAAFRAAGLDVHTESYTVASNPATAADGQQDIAQENVVAEIRGREDPGEIVILGAHLGSPIPDNGALTDNCDAAVVIEAARDIAATGLVPRRTIRFVLFTGGSEISGSTLGSAAYAHSHHDEMGRTLAAILFEFNAGLSARAGFSLDGRHDIEQGVREATEPLDALVSVTDSYDVTLGLDGLDFILEGVPNLVAYGEGHGLTRIGDTTPVALDASDIQELKRHAAIAGVTAFDVAEDVAPLGPRLSRAEIGSELKQTGLDDEMKGAGIWPQWESGQRGRQP
jgi:hypothetical protein